MTAAAAWRGLRRLLYWLLPPLLLWQVLVRVDIAGLSQLFGRLQPAWWAAALLCSGLIALTGALRWHLLATAGWPAAPTLGAMVADYWRSLAAGLLLPGTVGHDGYRVLRMARRGADLAGTLLRLLLEKLLALLGCIVLAAASAVLLGGPGPLATLGPGVAALLVLLLALGLVLRAMPAQALHILAGAARRWQPARLAQPHGGKTWAGTWPPPRAAGGAFGLSLWVLITAALQAQCCFLALGQVIDWRINLMVAPLMFLVLALPLSFGGIGVREAAHVALYGAFGVTAEVALAVSLLSLAGQALNWIAGALLWTRGRPGPATRQAAVEASSPP